MAMALEGKAAIITGASTPKGIGAAIARRFAQAGAQVHLVAEGTREQLEAVCAECRALPGCAGAGYAVFDLSRSGSAESMVSDAYKRMGRIDILVNNAGIRAETVFGEYTREVFERVVGVNLAAPFFASQSVVPIMTFLPTNGPSLSRRFRGFRSMRANDNTRGPTGVVRSRTRVDARKSRIARPPRATRPRATGRTAGGCLRRQPAHERRRHGDGRALGRGCDRRHRARVAGARAQCGNQGQHGQATQRSVHGESSALAE